MYSVEPDMSAQRTPASVEYDTKRKVTRRERFLQEMDGAIPCDVVTVHSFPADTRVGGRALLSRTERASGE